MINHVIEKQNDENAIELLKASSVAYMKAKYWELNVTYFLTFLAFAYPLYYVFSNDKQIQLILFGLSFLLTILVEFFHGTLMGNTFKGALLKENFDVYVLGIPKKSTTSDIDHGEILKLSLEFKGDDPFDWYSKNLSVSIPNSTSIAIIQHSNSNWDLELRKSYRFWLRLFLFFYSICLSVFFVIFNVNSVIMFSIAFSILSFYTHYFKLIRGQTAVIDKRMAISIKLDEIIRKKRNITIEEIRDIQDEIFITRQEPAKIPEYFCNYFKNKMAALSESYISEVNKMYNPE